MNDPTMRSVLPRHAVILVGVIVALWGFGLFARTLPTAAVVGVWLVVALWMLRALLPRRRIRRRVWLRAFFRRHSAWQWRLRGGLFMGMVQLLKALILSAAMLTVLVRIDDAAVWRILVAGALVLVVMRARVHEWFRHDLAPAYRPEFVWRLSLWGTGTVLVLLLAVMAFYRPQPDFTGASLAQAVWHQLDQEAARSGLLHEAVRALAAKEGFQFWLGQHLSGLPVAGAPAVALVWLLIFLEQGLFVTGVLVLFNASLIHLPPDAIAGHHAA